MTTMYDKMANKLIETSTPTITLRFEELQALLREHRELFLAVEALGLDPKTTMERYKARRASGQPYPEAKSAVLLENQVERCKDALKALLLFHGVGPWDKEKSAEWVKLTGHHDATTKVLCDNARRALTSVSSPADRRALRPTETQPDTSESPTGRLNVETKLNVRPIKPGTVIKCTQCDDTGVIETGNNDLPCTNCTAGRDVVFNTCDGPMTGAEAIKHHNSPYNQWPRSWGEKP